MAYLVGFGAGLMLVLFSILINYRLASKKEVLNFWKGWALGFVLRLGSLLAAVVTVFVLVEESRIEKKDAMQLSIGFAGAILAGLVLDAVLSVKRIKK